MKFEWTWFKKILPIIILIILVLPSIWFLFLPGFIKTDDGNWMIIRFSAFYQALHDGQFPVRFLGRLNFGYGYPVANFLYPGFMYLGVPLKLLGLSYISVINAILASSILISGVFYYFWLRSSFDKWESFFGGLLYVYLPYHIYDVTQRGSVGEVLSLAIIPFILWRIEKRDVILSSIGLGLLLISHNTLAILFLGLITLYAILSIYVAKERKELLGFYKKILIFGVGLSAFFTLPAILELQNTVFFQTKISEFANYFAPYNLVGLVSFAVLISASLVLIFKKDIFKKHSLTLLLLIISIISVFLSTEASSFIWQFLPVSFIQFPFRFLSLTILCIPFLFAFVISQTPLRYKFIYAVILMLITIYFSKDYLIPKGFNHEPDSFYSTNEATTTVQDEYMPTWVHKKPDSHPELPAKVISGEGNISNVSKDSEGISFDYNSASPGIVELSTIYYPGWVASSNGQPKAIFYDNERGLIQLKLEEGEQRVLLKFQETPVRILSDAVSVIAIILLIVYTVQNRYLKKKINFSWI